MEPICTACMVVHERPVEPVALFGDEAMPMAVYDRALTGAQVRHLYRTGVVPGAMVDPPLRPIDVERRIREEWEVPPTS